MNKQQAIDLANVFVNAFDRERLADENDADLDPFLAGIRAKLARSHREGVHEAVAAAAGIDKDVLTSIYFHFTHDEERITRTATLLQKGMS